MYNNKVGRRVNIEIKIQNINNYSITWNNDVSMSYHYCSIQY